MRFFGFRVLGESREVRLFGFGFWVKVGHLLRSCFVVHVSGWESEAV